MWGHYFGEEVRVLTKKGHWPQAEDLACLNLVSELHGFIGVSIWSDSRLFPNWAPGPEIHAGVCISAVRRLL
jgi:hypothetical protein